MSYLEDETTIALLFTSSSTITANYRSEDSAFPSIQLTAFKIMFTFIALQIATHLRKWE